MGALVLVPVLILFLFVRIFPSDFNGLFPQSIGLVQLGKIDGVPGNNALSFVSNI